MSTVPAELNLVKMEGAGNSFLFTWDSFPKNQRQELLKQLCDVHFGIGADGMAFLESSGPHEITWDFYNNDGSTAEFCGNAARCAAWLGFQKAKSAQSIKLNTIAGSLECALKGKNQIEVKMTMPQWIQSNLTLPIWHRPVVWLNAGVPHLVVEVEDAEELKKYKNEAAAMRSWEGLGPSGSNVTFVFAHSKDAVSAVSYERGVEDFTLACGSGAIAAASYHMQKYGTHQCKVQMPGGELIVRQENKAVFMLGPTRHIAELKIQTESYL